ncbi:LLM class flavin-dependent oxidoreductase [Rhodococcus olei]|uniref:LLM class flavin-dependent oxidoreductase n=1 Tax=Rhodococcus olei TaxID=2161675 RepID=A0ABP8PSD5_9NOCA
MASPTATPAFGVLISLQSTPDTGPTTADLYRTLPGLARDLERWGYDSVFFTEHHGSSTNEVASPLVVGAAVAAVTEQIRIGSVVAIPAFYHPVRLAEDVSTLDNLSAGRVTLGLGMGYRPSEFEGFGINPQEKLSRFIESQEIVRKALSGRPFDFTGKRYQLRNVVISPPPIQRGLPVWVGAQRRPGLERAGRLGLAVPLSGAPLTIAIRQRAIYDGALSAAGFSPGVVEYPVIRECFCAATDEEAWKIADPYITEQSAEYARHNQVIDTVAGDLPFDPDRMLIGSPATLVREFRRHHRRLPCDHWILRMHFPGMPLAVMRRSMALLAAEVLPALRSDWATSATVNAGYQRR